jgi:predicted nuclease with RNAse H fold
VRAVGIDLGASAIHVVELIAASGDRLAITTARTFDAEDIEAVVAVVRDADDVAIDAPAQLSTAPHAGDESISPKFRTARCGEIALGQVAGIWVPWVTPHDPAKVAAWMQVGFDLWHALRAAGHAPVEVYPAGVFRVLAGRVPPRKTTRAGARARIDLLAPFIALPPAIEMWSHDGIDALGAALVAAQKAGGTAREIVHGEAICDGSAIWLPAPPISLGSIP